MSVRVALDFIGPGTKPRKKNFQGSAVDCIPEGRPFLHSTVVNGLKVSEFAVQVQLKFLSFLGTFEFGFVEFLCKLRPCGLLLSWIKKFSLEMIRRWALQQSMPHMALVSRTSYLSFTLVMV